MTACAPLCGLADARRVTSRSPSQTKLCPKRVAGVRHPANSAQLKVAGEPGGRKKCRIKAGGRLRVPRPATPPRRAGRGVSIGGRNFHFLLGRVAGIRKFREKTTVFRHSARWLSQVVFRNFTGVGAGVIFYPLGASRGSVFPLSYSRRKIGGSRRGYLRISGRASCQEKKQICVRTSPETQQLVKEMCPLDSCRLLFKLAVELDMVMNALAAGMEIPDEQLRTLRSRCIQDVKNRRQYLAG